MLVYDVAFLTLVYLLTCVCIMSPSNLHQFVREKKDHVALYKACTVSPQLIKNERKENVVKTLPSTRRKGDTVVTVINKLPYRKEFYSYLG